MGEEMYWNSTASTLGHECGDEMALHCARASIPSRRTVRARATWESEGPPPPPPRPLPALGSAKEAPRWAWRSACAFLLGGQVVLRASRGRIHAKNFATQLRAVGPSSLGVAMLTSSFVGMVFTIQFVREFTRLGLTRSVGGVLGLALARELSPVITAVILAGRVGSAFAAEIGSMQVSEQVDMLRVLRADPVDFLVTPRVLATSVAMPLLTVICFTVGLAASTLLAAGVYNIPANVILDSVVRALRPWDMIAALVKSVCFGYIIAVVSCAWGFTTRGGAKGVGESTTSAVVISLVCVFIADFLLSYFFFQGEGDALKQLT